MPSNVDALMSREQLWDQLYSDMQSRGVIETLRSQMRDKLLQNLALVSTEKKVVNNVQVDVTDQRVLKTVNALIVDHLRLCGFNFTLSLFLPESGLASVDEARYSLRTGLADRAEEILDERLHERPDDSLLLKLMEPMTRMGWLREAEMKGRRRRPSASTVEVETQTERGKETDGVTGEAIPNGNGNDDNDDDDPKDSFQRRFFLLKKSVEERKASELTAEMQRFKENERKSIELDYARKLETEREKIRIEVEEKYKQRNSHLDVKEREMERLMKRKVEETERELCNQRNVLIDELQRSKIKEENLRSRETELDRRKEEAEKRLDNLREILEQREKMVKEREIDVEEKVRLEVRRTLANAEEEREERLKLLKREEDRVREMKEEWEKRKNEQDEVLGGEEARSVELKRLNGLYKREKEMREDAEEEMAGMKRRMEAVESLENLQSQNGALRRDLEEALVRERDSREQLEAERSTLRDMKHHLTSCSPEIIVNLKREAESLQSLVERQNENHRREMEEYGVRAKDLKRANKELREIIQRQNGEIESFNQIVGDLQLQLRYSQEALRILKLSGTNNPYDRQPTVIESSQDEVSDSTPKSTPSSKRRGADRSTRNTLSERTLTTAAHNEPPSRTVESPPKRDQNNQSNERLRDLLGQADELDSTFKRIAEKESQTQLSSRTSRGNHRVSGGGGGVSGSRTTPMERIQDGWRRRNLEERRRRSDVREFLDSFRPADDGISTMPQTDDRHGQRPRVSDRDGFSQEGLANATSDSRPSDILPRRPQEGDGDNFTSTPNRPDGLGGYFVNGRNSATTGGRRRRSKDETLNFDQQRRDIDSGLRGTTRSSPPAVTSTLSAERNLNLSDYEKERSLREERGGDGVRDSEEETDVDDRDDNDDGVGKERDEFGTLMEQPLESTTFQEPSQRITETSADRRHSQVLNQSEREVFGARGSSTEEEDLVQRRQQLVDEVNFAKKTINESLDQSKFRQLEESAMTLRNTTTASTRMRNLIEDSNVTLGDSALPIDDTIQEFNRVPKFVSPKASPSEFSSGSRAEDGKNSGREEAAGLTALAEKSIPDHGNGSKSRNVVVLAGMRKDSESSYDEEKESPKRAPSLISAHSRLNQVDHESIDHRSSSSFSSHSLAAKRNNGIMREGKANEPPVNSLPRVIDDSSDGSEPVVNSTPKAIDDNNDGTDGDEMNSELLRYVTKAKEERDKATTRGHHGDSDLSVGDASAAEVEDESKHSDGFW